MSFSTRYWQKEHGNLKSKVSEFIYTEKLSRSIAAMQPYGIYFGRNEKLETFFIGSSQNVTFVSEIGLYQEGPVIVSIRIVEGNELGVQVQVAEKPLQELMLTKDTQLENVDWEWNNIKSNMANAQFRFFGYSDLSQLMIERSVFINRRPKIKWYESYMGQQTSLLPNIIEITGQEVIAGETLSFSMEFPIMIDDKRRYLFIENARYAD